MITGGEWNRSGETGGERAWCRPSGTSVTSRSPVCSAVRDMRAAELLLFGTLRLRSKSVLVLFALFADLPLPLPFCVHDARSNCAISADRGGGGDGGRRAND